MSEENKPVQADQAGDAPQQGDANKTIDDYMNVHMQRWQKRAQIIAAVVAAFILYMGWFMLHS